jgi:hypothetical protein
MVKLIFNVPSVSHVEIEAELILLLMLLLVSIAERSKACTVYELLYPHAEDTGS